ncbi:UNVERIFIED_CONTAM: Alpha-N-acetylgalactosaminidase [Trichonephila clavipes]
MATCLSCESGYYLVFSILNSSDKLTANFANSLSSVIKDFTCLDAFFQKMHERGLKLGIYQDFGIRTCMGYPGIVGHMKQDSEAFAKWKVDMVKLDACHSRPSQMNEGYIAFGRYLNETNRPIVYSCSWPYYLLVNEIEVSF